MTDMRATERLLEVIAENAENLLHRQEYEGMATKEARKIIEAALELRRRGDTLVRRDDLRLVISEGQMDRGQVIQEFSLPSDPETETDIAWQAAIERLENAIGGKL
jgi:hypothetical protein